MKTIFENVIQRGGYDLAKMIKKIDTLWVQDHLSDEEREALIDSARAGANAENSVDLLAKVQELEKRVIALEKAADPIAGEETSAEEFIEGKWYYSGDACVFNGVTYTCIAPEGVACVWSPADFPAYWAKEEA